MTKPNDWTEGETKQLTEMWENGLAASAIAKELGRTRNSIIGRSHRLGLYRRTKTLLKANGIAKTIKPKKAKAKVDKVVKMVKVWTGPRPPEPWKKPKTEIVMPNVSKQVPLIETVEYQCRAIVEYADGKLDQAICCGEPVTMNRFTGAPMSWCAYHHSIYFEPPKESRDARGGTRRVAPNWSARRNPQVQTNPQAVKKSA